jgi:hypothetical protein
MTLSLADLQRLAGAPRGDFRGVGGGGVRSAIHPGRMVGKAPGFAVGTRPS